MKKYTLKMTEKKNYIRFELSGPNKYSGKYECIYYGNQRTFQDAMELVERFVNEREG